MKLGEVQPGVPGQLGPTPLADGTNIAVYTGPDATEAHVQLVDREHGGKGPLVKLKERTADSVWHGFIPGMTEGDRYNLYVNGPWKPEEGFRYNRHKALVDPYAKALDGRVDWKDGIVYGYDWQNQQNPNCDLTIDTRDSFGMVPTAKVVDWQKFVRDYGGALPQHALTEGPLVEAHVKNATKLLRIPFPGSYKALSSPEFIKSLRKGHVTHLQIMPPQYHVDEHFLVDRGKINHWGYNTIGFFAADPRYATPGADPAKELLQSLKILRENGIDVVMDIALGHTPEQGSHGPTLSLRGLDPFMYHHKKDRRYLEDFTGCGNAINMAHPRAQELGEKSLDYWLNFFAGARLDHAHTLGRLEGGEFSAHAPIYETLRNDKRFNTRPFSGEPWDMAGYSLGKDVPFAAFNDVYRERVRAAAFSRTGTDPRALSHVMTGSQGSVIDPAHSVNYITIHDGATPSVLAQEGLGFSDRDMRDPKKRAEVQSRIQFAYAILAVSVGVPALHMGHPAGMSNGRNHDPYDKDDKDIWTPWSADMQPWQKNCLKFVRDAFDFRQHHPQLQRDAFLTEGKIDPATHKKEVAWYNAAGKEMTPDDWAHGQAFSYVLSGKAQAPLSQAEKLKRPHGIKADSDVYIIVNDSVDPIKFILPAQAPGENWKLAINSHNLEGHAGDAGRLASGSTIDVPGFSLLAFEAGHERNVARRGNKNEAPTR